MNSDLLQNFAEVATGFTGFSGVVVAVTRRQRGQWEPYESDVIKVLLVTSIAVVFFGFLPQVLGELPLIRHLAELSSSALFTLYHIGFACWGFFINERARSQGYAHAPLKVQIIVPIIGLSILATQIAGLTPQFRSWLPFSYVLALLLFLSVSVVAFSLLIMRGGTDAA
jgi:hypothetical protein